MIALAVVVALTVGGNVAFAQAKPGQAPAIPTFTGQLGEITKKGTLTVATVVADVGGDPIEVPLTPLMTLMIDAKGDAGFLREKQFVTGTGFVNNGQLLVEKWTVHVGPATKKMAPSSQPLSDTDESGEKRAKTGVKYMDVTAQVMSIADDKNDPGRQIVTLKFGSPKGTPANADKKAPITVRSTDPAMLKAGSQVEFIATGNMKKPKIVALKVKLEDALKSAEFFAAEEEARTKK